MTSRLNTYLLSLWRKYPVYFVGIFTCAMSGSIFSLLVNYQVKDIIDSIAKNGGKDAGIYIILFITYRAAHHGVYFVIRLFNLKYKPRLTAEIITDAYDKVMMQSLHWFDSRLSGETAGKVIDLQENTNSLIQRSCWWLGNVICILLSIAFLWRTDAVSALVLLTFIAVYTPAVTWMMKRQITLQQELTAARQKAAGIINDSIANVLSVKVIGNPEVEKRLSLLPAVDRWRKCDRAAIHYDTFYIDLVDTVLVVAMAGTQIYLMTNRLCAGAITAGDFAFITGITIMVHRELAYMLDGLLFEITPKLASIKSSLSFIDTEPDIADKPDAVVLPRGRGEIVFEDVRFAYDTGREIFNGLNLHIKAGERVGIVGASGAGKTTLVKSLLRYFDINGGNILIDGHDIREVTQESLRANLSMIPQDITLFHRTILENLLIAKPDATMGEIEEACRKANIHDDILRMQHGYNSVVGERGIKISGGQRQRIAIARALLKNAPVLILDEATSALDSTTERQVQTAVTDMLDHGGATAVVIAHRLSTLLHLDRILVFDKGRVVEEGTHQDLLRHGGLYNTLWETQAGGFLP